MKMYTLLATIALVACAPAARGQDSSMVTSQGDLPRPGLGTLGQDDIAITLRQEEIEIRIVPMDERLLRLLVADAYTSLHGILQGHAEEIDSVSRRNGVTVPGLLFVTFFGRRAGARFDPQNLSLVIRNQLYRPIGIVPYSANFSAQQVDVRQQASGIFLFEELIPVFEPFTVSYGATSSDAWESRLNQLQRERSRVMSRARADSVVSQ